MWHKLDADIEAMFRKWARENPRSANKCAANWHPIIRDEWKRVKGEQVKS